MIIFSNQIVKSSHINFGFEEHFKLYKQVSNVYLTQQAKSHKKLIVPSRSLCQNCNH